MNSNQILTITVFVIVITIIGTIALAVVGYVAFRLRERKQPTRPGMDQTLTKPYFFERVRLPAPIALQGETTTVLALAKGSDAPRPRGSLELMKRSY
jgi:hypothetical protein